MSETIELREGEARVLVSTHGAEPLEWQVCGKPVLWQMDPDVWPKTCPVLFPVIGQCTGGKIRVNGRNYPMGLHGFAASTVFDVVERSDNEVVMSLSNDAQTFEHYPFLFQLLVRHRLQNDLYSISFEVKNSGNEILPYALGVHPGFIWKISDETGRKGVLEFECDEDCQVPVITQDGLFSRDLRDTPMMDKKLVLNEPLLANNALCYLNIGSNQVCFAAPGQATIRIGMQGFPHLAVWSKPGAPFLCLEAWTGHADFEGFEGELADKPSMQSLPPGHTGYHRVTYEILEGTVN